LKPYVCNSRRVFAPLTSTLMRKLRAIILGSGFLKHVAILQQCLDLKNKEC
jgi:hypothetical protein